MTRAMWKGAVLAESEHCIPLEGNYYFPPGSVKSEYLVASETRTQCAWKGTAHYYTVTVGDARNPDAAWYYPDPKPAAAEIGDYVAFWRGVEIET